MLRILIAAAVVVALLDVIQARIVNLHEERNQIASALGEAQRLSNHFARRARDSFCSSPVSKQKVSFPNSIAGRAKINYDMYSGYVNITSAPDYYFYWFFGTQDGNPNAPLIVWTNGGPGCTSMEGATTENGPLNLFDIKESCSNGGPDSKCDYTGQLSSNFYAWNAYANVIYLDQPKNVGYSFGYGSPTSSSVEAGQDFVIFYNEWLKLFPEFVNRPLIVAGESYGGHYIPAWVNAVMDFNTANINNAIPLKAAVIGNGCINDTVQNTDQYIAFQKENNLIDPSSHPKTQASAVTEMNKYIGYTANYYDYRLEAVNCPACYSYNYTAWSYWFLQSEVLTALSVCGDAGNDAFAGSAGGCIGMGNFDSRDNFDYSGALGRALDNNIRVLLYYGKTDTACNYKGGQAVAASIPFKGSADFNALPYSSWQLGGVEAGQAKSAGGLTFIQVESAGHMVALDLQPASAQIISTVLASIN
jgi:cathepsin A (carboxypeptidase C)